MCQFKICTSYTSASAGIGSHSGATDVGSGIGLAPLCDGKSNLVLRQPVLAGAAQYEITFKKNSGCGGWGCSE